MTIAEFKIELARLLKKGSTSGLSSDDMAYELAEAAEDVTSVERTTNSPGNQAGFIATRLAM